MLGIAQPPIAAPLLAICALAAWVLAIRAAGTHLRVFTYSTLFVISYGLVVIAWIPAALNSLAGAVGAGPVWVAGLALWSALPIFLGSGLIVFWTRDWNDVLAIASLATAVGFLEWIDGTRALSIPWARIGHSQIESAGVAQLAVVGGVPIVSSLTSAVSFATALLFERRSPDRLHIAGCAWGAWISLHCLGLPTAKLFESPAGETSSTRITIAQPDIPRAERWIPELQALNVERAASVTRQAVRTADEPPDLVVWPENLVTAPIDQNEGLKAQIQAEIDQLGVPVLLGAVRSSPAETMHSYRSSVLWWSPRLGIIAATDKERAVPVLEGRGRSVFERTLTARFYGGEPPDLVETVQRGVDIHGSFTLTPVLCWEVLFADLVAARRSEESRLIVNLADDSWVVGEAATEQLSAFARYRAIEQRLPLIRIAHGGRSEFVDRFGQTVHQLPTDRYAHATVDIPMPSKATRSERLALISLPMMSSIIVWLAWTPGRKILARRCRSEIQ